MNPRLRQPADELERTTFVCLSPAYRVTFQTAFVSDETNQPNDEIIVYQSDDGFTRVRLRAADGTVWLSQREMAGLFDVSSDNIGLHLKNIYHEGELTKRQLPRIPR